MATALLPPLSPRTDSTVDQWLMETTQDKSNQELEAAISYIQNTRETAKQTHFLNKRLLSPQPTAPEGSRAPHCHLHHPMTHSSPHPGPYHEATRSNHGAHGWDRRQKSLTRMLLTIVDLSA